MKKLKIRNIFGKIDKWFYTQVSKMFPINMDKDYVDQVGMKKFRFADRQIASFYLPYGIKQLDSEYAERIISSKENSKRLKKEIKSNPHLHWKIKRNLLFNLRNRNMKVIYLEKGSKVHYIPYKYCYSTQYENGIVKEVVNDHEVRVVYHCAGEWENYENYTSALTDIKYLRLGWVP